MDKKEAAMVTLFDYYYAQYIGNGAPESEASYYAYELACADIREMNYQELRRYIANLS